MPALAQVHIQRLSPGVARHWFIYLPLVFTCILVPLIHPDDNTWSFWVIYVSRLSHMQVAFLVFWEGLATTEVLYPVMRSLFGRHNDIPCKYDVIFNIIIYPMFLQCLLLILYTHSTNVLSLLSVFFMMYRWKVKIQRNLVYKCVSTVSWFNPLMDCYLSKKPKSLKRKIMNILPLSRLSCSIPSSSLCISREVDVCEDRWESGRITG